MENARRVDAEAQTYATAYMCLKKHDVAKTKHII